MNLFINNLIIIANGNYETIQAKAPTGQKKSKDQIAKAASQKKGGAKVPALIFRNGPREKQKKNASTPSSSIEPPTTA